MYITASSPQEAPWGTKLHKLCEAQGQESADIQRQQQEGTRTPPIYNSHLLLMRGSIDSLQAAGWETGSQLRVPQELPWDPSPGLGITSLSDQALLLLAQGPAQMCLAQPSGTWIWPWTSGKLPEHAENATLRIWWWLQGGMGSREACSFIHRWRCPFTAGAVHG